MPWISWKLKENIPSLIESWTFFSNQSYLFYCIGFLIIRSKNYLFHAGKFIKYTDDIDVNNALCCPTHTALRPKNILVAVAATVVMSSPSPIGFSTTDAAMVGPSPIAFVNIFLTITITHLLYRSSNLKYMTSFWWLILLFIDEFFIF